MPACSKLRRATETKGAPPQPGGRSLRRRKSSPYGDLFRGYEPSLRHGRGNPRGFQLNCKSAFSGSLSSWAQASRLTAAASSAVSLPCNRRRSGYRHPAQVLLTPAHCFAASRQVAASRPLPSGALPFAFALGEQLAGLSIPSVNPRPNFGPRTRPKNGIPKGKALRRRAWEAAPPKRPSPLRPRFSTVLGRLRTRFTPGQPFLTGTSSSGQRSPPGFPRAVRPGREPPRPRFENPSNA